MAGFLLVLSMEKAMGTVGLSFGSPTSGAGFDVSATVSQIVANLEKVESPWKNQLSSLESQDTVISNLGTLFSNLSKDVSSLTDFEGIMAQKTGSSSDTNVLELTAATSSATAGTHTVVVNSLAATASGYLAEVSGSSTALSGQITLQVGNGTAKTFVIGAQSGSGSSGNTVYTGSGANTLSNLASAINSSGVGITANVESDSTASWLSLTSETSGASGNIAVSGNTLAATGQILSFSGTAGTDASGSSGATTSSGTLPPVGSSDQLTGSLSIQVGSGTAVTVSMSAVKSATGGTTVGDLATYLQDNYSSMLTAQAVDGGNGTQSLSLTSSTPGSAGTLTVNSSLTDSSSSALGYTSAVTGADANLTIDGKSNIHSSSNTVSNLIPGVTFQLLSSSSTPVQVIVGNDNSAIESTVNQFVTDYNALIRAINTQEGKDSSGNPEPLFGSPTLSLLQQQLLSGMNTQSPNGYLDAIKNASDALSGSITISLAGGLRLDYSGSAGADSQASTGTLHPIENAGDTLSGSISIQVGSGTAHLVNVGDSSTFGTLAGLASAINDASIGVTASVVTNSDGSSSLSLLSGTPGSGGTLTVTSSIVDTSPQTIQVPTTSGDNTLAGLAAAINSSHSGVTANVVTTSSGSQLELVSNIAGSNGALSVSSSITDTATSTVLDYNSDSTDINSMTGLGISVNNDGSLTFDANSLDAVLNSDFSSVAGFFQNANSWGQMFANLLTNAGTSSPTGILKLAQTANSNTESTLNAEISKEDALIAAQQKSLTAELNTANQILQELPTQLQGMNELYSAITGYNQNGNG